MIRVSEAPPAAATPGEVRPAAGALGWRTGSLMLLVLLGLAIVLQLLSGAYESELAHFPDEPAHVITTLLFHDYLRSGMAQPPLQFAEQYYVRYPKVAIGMWPPVYYAVAAAWTHLMGASRVSLLLFTAVLGAGLSFTLALFVRRLYGTALGLTAGVVLTGLHLMQQNNSMFMLDTAVSLACFWVMLLMISYFQTERLRTALALGLMAAVAAMVKGNGNAVVLMVALMLLLTARYRLLLRPALYAGAAIFAIFGLPWQIISLKMLSSSVPMAEINVQYFLRMFGGYSAILATQFMPLMAVLMAVPIIGLLRARINGGHASLELAGAASLFAAILLFHCITPNPGPDWRYMSAALAPGVALFIAGAKQLSELPLWRPARPGVRCGALIGVSLLSGALFGAFTVPEFPVLGYRHAAVQALAANGANNALLVSSDSTGEGAFIVEVRLLDPDLKRTVLRASKMISESPWTSASVKLLFRSGAEVAEFLNAAAVDVVVVDHSKTESEESRALLLAGLRVPPAIWTASEVTGRSARKITIYTRGDKLRQPAGSLRIRLPYTLGRDLELKK